MKKKMDLTGQRFNRLVVIHEVEPVRHPNGKPSRRYLCLCDCGRRTISMVTMLRNGEKQSCGCLHKDILADTSIKRRYTHGHAKKGRLSATYKSWINMNHRCMRTSGHHYEHYRGRGIIVCDRWKGKFGFLNFFEDMGERPEGTSIDRIDVNGNYEPSNCRWATTAIQVRNRRKRLIETDICGYGF